MKTLLSLAAFYLIFLVILTLFQRKFIYFPYQLDKEFETVSESLGVPFYKTFSRVTVPVCLPAVLEIGMYYFVNSMATVSAVIFLYSADIPLASVAIANMDDAGDVAPACAMSILVILTNLFVRILYGWLTRGVRKKNQAWTVR